MLLKSIERMLRRIRTVRTWLHIGRIACSAPGDKSLPISSWVVTDIWNPLPWSQRNHPSIQHLWKSAHKLPSSRFKCGSACFLVFLGLVGPANRFTMRWISPTDASGGSAWSRSRRRRCLLVRSRDCIDRAVVRTLAKSRIAHSSTERSSTAKRVARNLDQSFLKSKCENQI